MVLARFACEEHPAARRSVLEKQGPRPKHSPRAANSRYKQLGMQSVFDLGSREERLPFLSCPGHRAGRRYMDKYLAC